MADNPRDFNKWVKSVERRLNQAIRSGQSATAVNLARDVQNVRDQIGSIEVGAGRQPAAPVEIVVQTAIHTDSAGQKFGSVSATFPPVTMGMDAQPIDVDRYELWVRDEDATIGDPDGEVARPNLITNPPSELQVSSGERERFFNDLTLGQHFEAGDELEFTVSAITSTNYNLADGADMSRHRINFTGLPEQEGSEDIGQSDEEFSSSHLPTFETGAEWQEVSFRVTVPEGYATLRPSIRTAHNGGWIMFDNIRVVNLSHEPPGAQRRGMELVTTSASTSLQFDGVTPGRRYEVGVRAVAHGSPSPMSRLRSVTVERDTTPPPIPSPLSLSSSGATVTATWDSLAATGDEMPVDFSFTEMAYGPAPDQVSQVSASLTMLFTSYIFETPPIPDDENYDGTWYFRHRAVDTSGNRSAWSPLTQIVPKKLVDDASIRFELEEKQRQIDEAKRLMDTGLTEVNDKLIPLEQLSQNNRAALDTLNNTTLPALEGDLTALQGELDGIDLTGINSRLDEAEGDLEALNNTTIPALERDLMALQGELDGIDLTVINTRLDEARSDLDTLNNTTLPSLERDLTALQGELEGIDLTSINTRLDGAESDLEALNNTTLPALERDLTALQSELDGIDLTGMSSRLDEAESDLNTLNNTTLPQLNNTITQGLADLDWREVGAISASNIRVGSYENLLPEDYIWELREKGLDGTPLWGDTSGGAAGWNTILNQRGMPILIRFSTSQHNGETSRLAFMGPSGKGFRVSPGEEFSLTGSGWVSSGASDELLLQIRYATENGSYVTRSTAGQFPNGLFSHTWRVPDDSTIQRMQIEFTATSNASGNAHMGDIRLRTRVTSNLIVDGAVIADKIAANAVESDKIAANAITAAKIAANAVTADKINANAVTADKINANAVTAGKISANAVTAREVAADSIAADHLQANSVTAGKIAANAVTANKIDANAVTANKIAANAVTAGKISANAVSAREIAANAVTAGKIAANAVTAGEIAANAVTADKINANAVNADKIAANAITTAKIATSAVTANEIAANSVTADKILANAVTADKIAASAVTANKIDANAVDADKIAANAVTAGKIAANAVTAREVAADSISANHLQANSVGANQIIANSVGAEHVQARSIQAHNLQVGSFDNLFSDPMFHSFRDYGTSSRSPWSQVTGDPESSWQWELHSTAGDSIVNRSSSPSRMELYCGKVVPGDEISFRIRVRKNSSANGFRISARHRGENRASPLHSTALLGDSLSSLPTDSYWDFNWTVPNQPDISELWIDFEVQPGTTGDIRFSETSIRKRIASRLLVDGAVVARTIAAEAVNAEHITASNSLSAKVASFLSVESNMIAANAVTADKISFGSLNGALITGLQIQTHTNNRGVKLTSAGIRAFNSSGSETFNVNASNGSVTANGGTFTGSTFHTDPRWPSIGGAVIRQDGTHGNIVAADTSGRTVVRLGGARNELRNLSVGSLSVDGELRVGGNGEGGIVPESGRTRFVGRTPQTSASEDTVAYGRTAGISYRPQLGPNMFSLTYEAPTSPGARTPIAQVHIGSSYINRTGPPVLWNTGNRTSSGFRLKTHAAGLDFEIEIWIYYMAYWGEPRNSPINTG